MPFFLSFITFMNCTCMLFSKQRHYCLSNNGWYSVPVQNTPESKMAQWTIVLEKFWTAGVCISSSVPNSKYWKLPQRRILSFLQVKLRFLVPNCCTIHQVALLRPRRSFTLHLSWQVVPPKQHSLSKSRPSTLCPFFFPHTSPGLSWPHITTQWRTVSKKLSFSLSSFFFFFN